MVLLLRSLPVVVLRLGGDIQRRGRTQPCAGREREPYAAAAASAWAGILIGAMWDSILILTPPASTCAAVGATAGLRLERRALPVSWLCGPVGERVVFPGRDGAAGRGRLLRDVSRRVPSRNLAHSVQFCARPVGVPFPDGDPDCSYVKSTPSPGLLL